MSKTIKDILKDQSILEFSMNARAYGIDNGGDDVPNNVPVDNRIDVDVLTADDDSPMFVNLEVLRNGISNGNRRYFDSSVVRQVCDMIPGVPGFLGHPDPSKVGFEFREPHCIFVGSMIEELDGGASVRALAKAYIFKSSPLREWIPKSIACGNPLTVSINGVGDIARDNVNNIIRVQNMTKLDSIDWANPGTQGMPDSKAYSIVTEMQGGDNKMDRIEIIKDATISELKENNPTVYSAIENGAKITEMSLNVDGEAKTVKLDAVQSIIDTKDAKITELQGTIDTIKAEAEKAKLDSFKSAKITEMVDAKYVDKIAERVTGNTEAEITASIESEIAYIKEMIGEESIAPSKVPGGKVERTDHNDMISHVRGIFGVQSK